MVTAHRGKIVFVGDEITALGFRLAGIETRVPEPGDVESVLAVAQRDAALVIVTAELALGIAKPLKDGAVLVIESARGDVSPPDLALQARRELGILP